MYTTVANIKLWPYLHITIKQAKDHNAVPQTYYETLYFALWR